LPLPEIKTDLVLSHQQMGIIFPEEWRIPNASKAKKPKRAGAARTEIQTTLLEAFKQGKTITEAADAHNASRKEIAEALVEHMIEVLRRGEDIEMESTRLGASPVRVRKLLKASPYALEAQNLYAAVKKDRRIKIKALAKDGPEVTKAKALLRDGWTIPAISKETGVPVGWLRSLTRSIQDRPKQNRGRKPAPKKEAAEKPKQAQKKPVAAKKPAGKRPAPKKAPGKAGSPKKAAPKVAKRPSK
jgi:hypothetical protein